MAKMEEAKRYQVYVKRFPIEHFEQADGGRYQVKVQEVLADHGISTTLKSLRVAFLSTGLPRLAHAEFGVPIGGIEPILAAGSLCLNLRNLYWDIYAREVETPLEEGRRGTEAKPAPLAVGQIRHGDIRGVGICTFKVVSRREGGSSWGVRKLDSFTSEDERDRAYGFRDEWPSTLVSEPVPLRGVFVGSDYFPPNTARVPIATGEWRSHHYWIVATRADATEPPHLDDVQVTPATIRRCARIIFLRDDGTLVVLKDNQAKTTTK